MKEVERFCGFWVSARVIKRRRGQSRWAAVCIRCEWLTTGAPKLRRPPAAKHSGHLHPGMLSYKGLRHLLWSQAAGLVSGREDCWGGWTFQDAETVETWQEDTGPGHTAILTHSVSVWLLRQSRSHGQEEEDLCCNLSHLCIS